MTRFKKDMIHITLSLLVTILLVVILTDRVIPQIVYFIMLVSSIYNGIIVNRFINKYYN